MNIRSWCFSFGTPLDISTAPYYYSVYAYTEYALNDAKKSMVVGCCIRMECHSCILWSILVDGNFRYYSCSA